MAVVLDANNIIHREIPEEAHDIYTTSAVVQEIKDEESVDYLQSNLFRITVRDPKDEFVERVVKAIEGSLLYLSAADVGVVALVLELSEEVGDEWITESNIAADRTVKCNSEDNGVRNALNRLGLLYGDYVEKKFKLRCYACSTVYDTHVDFCKNCGYNTITRVTVVDTKDGEKVMLKANYVAKPKVLKGTNGVEIRSADQKEYATLLRQRERAQRSLKNRDFYE